MPKTPRVAGLALAVAAGMLTSGCMTYDTRVDGGYDGPRVYSGTRLAAAQAGDQFMNLNLPWVLLFGLDLPLCFVADTLLLPWTIPEESARRASLTQTLQTSDSRPSAIDVPADTPPLDAARELFAECVNRLKQYDPLVTDCFAQEARIFYDEGEPRMLSGREFKSRVRAAVADFQRSGEFVIWRRPSFEEDAGRVRIEADRSSSQRGDVGRVSLWVERLADGGWRIVELRGARWR